MLDRRQLFSVLAASGIGSSVFHRALIASAQENEITVDNLKQAEWISGVELTEQQREEILRNVKQNERGNQTLRKVKLSHETGPAIHFRTLSKRPKIEVVEREAMTTVSVVRDLPETDLEIAFLPVSQLSWLLRTGKLTSVRLTEIYLERLKKYGPMLRCVVNLTEDLAMQQAHDADKELAAGKYRGHLHGVPWGAKDLIDVEGYPTTWGIPHYKERISETTATVAKRLEQAGAVLIAKLSLGALAMGDKWFGGMTRSPWNPRIGSSGSSAGSAAATVAGLVGFSLGTETLGSILSPAIRCGASGMRPTFGRVSRYGCMPLSWSMDKVGPICRSVEDCALVFDAIHGADGLDPTVSSFDFNWPCRIKLAGLRVGYKKSSTTPDDEREDLKLIKSLGCELVEVKLPTEIPLRALTSIIDVEGASVFDQLLRDGHTEGWNTWTKTFRAAQHISAVDYIRFQRARTDLMYLFEKAIADVDVIVNMRDLVHTNFTGHPSVVCPAGYQTSGEGKSVTPFVVTGHLNDDSRVLAFAHACQRKLDANLSHPELDSWLEKFEAGTLDEPEEKEDMEDEKQGNG